jgi:hypothetical protein
VAYTTLGDPQGRLSPTLAFHHFLAGSFSPDGTRFTLTASGRGNADALVMVDGAFTVDPAAR